MTHWLSYSHSDQALLRDADLADAWDGLVVPGTLATYYLEGTGGFVLAQQREYVIDPRTPLLQTNDEIRRPQPRASHLSLLAIHDPSVLETWPDEEIPLEHWRQEGVWRQTVDRVLDFQEKYAQRASGKVEKYLALLAEARNEMPMEPAPLADPLRFVPPYWACTGADDPWWELSRAATQQAVGRFQAGNRIIPIVAVTRDTSVSTLADLVRQLPAECDRAFCWRGDWVEAQAGEHDVAGWKSVIDAGIDCGVAVANLYGGYLSVLLTAIGLDGLSHGVGYSESRDVRRLGETGAPPTRYYIPALHKFETVPNAQPVIDHLPREWSCDCPVCRAAEENGRTVVSRLSTEQRKWHFLNVRRAELAAVGEDPEAALDRLRQTANWLRENPRPEAILPSEATRLSTWERAVRIRLSEEWARSELAARLEAWRAMSEANDRSFLATIAETLPGDDATVEQSAVTGITGVEEVATGFRATLTTNTNSHHRTEEADPDTFGPNDIRDWVVEVSIDLDDSGEVADVNLSPT